MKHGAIIYDTIPLYERIVKREREEKKRDGATCEWDERSEGGSELEDSSFGFARPNYLARVMGVMRTLLMMVGSGRGFDECYG